MRCGAFLKTDVFGSKSELLYYKCKLDVVGRGSIWLQSTLEPFLIEAARRLEEED